MKRKKHHMTRKQQEEMMEAIATGTVVGSMANALRGNSPYMATGKRLRPLATTLDMEDNNMDTEHITQGICNQVIVMLQTDLHTVPNIGDEIYHMLTEITEAEHKDATQVSNAVEDLLYALEHLPQVNMVQFFEQLKEYTKIPTKTAYLIRLMVQDNIRLITFNMAKQFVPIATHIQQIGIKTEELLNLLYNEKDGWYI